MNHLLKQLVSIMAEGTIFFKSNIGTIYEVTKLEVKENSLIVTTDYFVETLILNGTQTKLICLDNWIHKFRCRYLASNDLCMLYSAKILPIESMTVTHLNILKITSISWLDKNLNYKYPIPIKDLPAEGYIKDYTEEDEDRRIWAEKLMRLFREIELVNHSNNNNNNKGAVKPL